MNYYDISILTMVYKPTYNWWGGHHLVIIKPLYNCLLRIFLSEAESPGDLLAPCNVNIS